jgi:hypothetical protein
VETPAVTANTTSIAYSACEGRPSSLSRASKKLRSSFSIPGISGSLAARLNHATSSSTAPRGTTARIQFAMLIWSSAGTLGNIPSQIFTNCKFVGVPTRVVSPPMLAA